LLANNHNTIIVHTASKKGGLVPNNGTKTDPAHPAFYPTGIVPTLESRSAKIYDLIVRRFMLHLENLHYGKQ